MGHRDETGKPCTRHAEVAPDRVLELAMIGSRAAGFHHDAASKLQSLVMSVDEISELSAADDADLRAALDTAQGALRELHALLNDNRALAKPAQRTRVALGDVLARAADRSGVRLQGELAASEVQVAVPALQHALAMLFDVVGGPRHAGRTVDVASVRDGTRVRLTLTAAAESTGKPTAQASEALAIAGFVIQREGGELRCAGTDRLVVELPVATA